LQVDQIVAELLARGDMNDDTVLELNRNLADWRAGTLDADDEAYLRALHARIVSGAVAEPIEETSGGPSRIDGLSIEEWRERALKAEAELAEIADATRAG
jgi:hypothetical protein